MVHESSPHQVVTASIGVARTHPFPGSTRRHAPLRLLPLLVHGRRDPSCGLPTGDPTASGTRDPVQDVGARREQPIDVDCCIRAELSIDPALTPASPPVAAPCDLQSVGRACNRQIGRDPQIWVDLAHACNSSLHLRNSAEQPIGDRRYTPGGGPVGLLMRGSGRPRCGLLEAACADLRKGHAGAAEAEERIQWAQPHGTGEALDGVVRMSQIDPQPSAHVPYRRCVWVQNQRSLHMDCTGLDLIRLSGATPQWTTVVTKLCGCVRG